MSHDLSSNARQSVQSSAKPFDDIENLYIAQIVKAPGSIQTKGKTLPATLWGEILLYGRIKDGTFVAERLRRVALYGSLTNPPEGDPIRVFSLAGPLNKVALGSDHTANSVHLTLHYDALSSELPPRIKGEHVMYPQLEQIAAKLTWVQKGSPEKSTVLLEITFSATELIDVKQGMGKIEQVRLGPMVIPFHLAGTGAKPVVKHHSLSSDRGDALPLSPDECDAPTDDLCVPTNRRRLRLRFINFSEAADAQSTCQAQLNKLCEVWRNKAALYMDLTRSPCLVEGTSDQKSNFSTLGDDQVSSLPLQTDDGGELYAKEEELEIFVIDNFVVDYGGANTYNDGEASAFIVLELGPADPDEGHPSTARTNPYVLAHELGHVVGLAHPDGTQGDVPSSWGSVMEVGNPNPDFNTLYNCQIFTDSVGERPHNPLVGVDHDDDDLPISDCFRPDPVDHFIRDFQEDNGIEPSVPPIGENHWSNSNIWNRRADDRGDTHEEPFCTDETNYLYVKLEYLTSLRDPVTVDLYLADPGVSPGHELLTPLASTNSIVFDPPPEPESPLTKALPWSPSTALAGFPQACCVFALAHSEDEPLPFDDPSTVTFRDVFPLLGVDNDIAQRNLHVQDCIIMNKVMLQTWLPWVQMANPFKRTARARVEIDTTQASNLRGLAVEVDNKRVRKIKAGEKTSVILSDALRPDDHKILRLRATLPPTASEGMTFPIHLRFVVNNKVVGGYTHLLRVAPRSEAVLQVLDHLYGALRDVGAGCRSKQAQDLAEKVKGIVLKERLVARQPGRRSVWRSRVRNLSKDVAALARGLELDIHEPERKIVRRNLHKLARQLLAPKDTPAAVFIEGIRDLADRIQEPAGRLARRQQSAQREVTS